VEVNNWDVDRLLNNARNQNVIEMNGIWNSGVSLDT
jgi:hypothetical protein